MDFDELFNKKCLVKKSTFSKYFPGEAALYESNCETKLETNLLNNIIPFDIRVETISSNGGKLTLDCGITLLIHER